MKRKFLQICALGVMLFAPFVASAHIGSGRASGVWDGFWHLLTGLDHILVMAAVGIWAAQIDERKIKWAGSGILMVSAFALFYGYAHSFEISAVAHAQKTAYTLGFAIASVLVYAGGLELGKISQKGLDSITLRYASVGVAVAGMYLFFS